MLNRSMSAKLAQGQCLDVLKFAEPVTSGDDGIYRVGPSLTIDAFIDGKDLCVATGEAWVWSVGRALRNHHDPALGGDVNAGDVFISTDARFYQNPNFECLWLR